MEKVIKGLRRIHSNTRETERISVYESGYMYIPAFIRRQIEDRFEVCAVDIYADERKKKLILIPRKDGDYTLSSSGSGYRVCVHTILNHVIDAGRHRFTIDDADGEMFIIIDCSAS